MNQKIIPRPVIAGDILEITYSNPNPKIGSGRFFAKAAEEGTFCLGGYESDDDKNNVDCGGNHIRKMRLVTASFEVVVSWNMNTDNELQKLMELSSELTESDWTINHVNGTSWGMKGVPVGEISGNTGSATFRLKVAGGGVMKEQLWHL